MTLHRKFPFWIALLVLVLIAVFFPKVASMTFGKRLVVQSMEKRLRGKVDIDSLSLSWFGPQRIQGIHFSSPDAVGFVEELETAAPLWSFSKVQGPFRIENGSVSFPKAEGKIERVNGEIQGNEFHLSGATAQGSAGGFLSAEGSFYSENDFDIRFDCKRIPSALLDTVAKGLSPILGPNFDAAGRIKNPGPIEMDFSSDNVKAVLKGNLAENTLTLRDPLAASFYLTENLSQTLLRGVNPLFLTGVASQSPVSFRIAPDGFSFPLAPFSLRRFQIGQATLDMGQIQCRIGKSLASLLALLKASRFSNAREINAWFTPVSFSLQNGTLRTGRMDALLSDSIHICTWGDIDLSTDRMQMFLGLPADTLRQSFGIKNLSDNFVLKVPITGTTKDPDLEKGPAASKIAAMIAGQQIPKKGEIFGGLINQFIQTQEKSGVPPPNRPFPWER